MQDVQKMFSVGKVFDNDIRSSFHETASPVRTSCNGNAQSIVRPGTHHITRCIPYDNAVRKIEVSSQYYPKTFDCNRQ